MYNYLMQTCSSLVNHSILHHILSLMKNVGSKHAFFVYLKLIFLPSSEKVTLREASVSDRSHCGPRVLRLQRSHVRTCRLAGGSHFWLL